MKRNRGGLVFRGTALAGCLFALLGCQCTSDPTQAGFFCGAANLANGTYDQAVARKQKQLQQAESNANAAAVRAAAAQESQEKAAAERDKWERDVAAMQAELKKLQTQLVDAKRHRSAADKQVAEAERKLKEAQEQLRQAPPDVPSPEDQRAYQRKIQAAEAAVRLVSEGE